MDYCLHNYFNYDVDKYNFRQVVLYALKNHICCLHLRDMSTSHLSLYDVNDWLVNTKRDEEDLVIAEENLKFAIEQDGTKEVSFEEYKDKYKEAMDDDLNTADAISVVFELARAINSNLADMSKESKENALKLIEELCGVIGILKEEETNNLDDEIEKLIEERQTARKERNFARADEIRDMLKEQGIVLEDTPQGVKWKRL